MHADAPPRDVDRPPPDGRKRRACLDALATPATIAELAARLDWDYDRVKSWVKVLERGGLVTRIAWVRSGAGQLAGRYQRVTP